MLIVKDHDFEMEQCKSSPFFDLKIATIINKGKANERTELKLVGYSMPFESCVEYIIAHRLSEKNLSLSITGFIEVYEAEFKSLKQSIIVCEKIDEKRLKAKKDDDEEIEEVD